MVKTEQEKYHISIHVPHRRDDLWTSCNADDIAISIHVPHRRDDIAEEMYADMDYIISIHVPHRRDDFTQHA